MSISSIFSDLFHDFLLGAEDGLIVRGSEDFLETGGVHQVNRGFLVSAYVNKSSAVNSIAVSAAPSLPESELQGLVSLGLVVVIDVEIVIFEVDQIVIDFEIVFSTQFVEISINVLDEFNQSFSSTRISVRSSYRSSSSSCFERNLRIGASTGMVSPFART